MKQKVILISMPWANPMSPSIQMGSLKAHLDEKSIPQCEAKCVSAQLHIPLLAAGPSQFKSFFSCVEAFEEYPYAYLLLRDFLRTELKGDGELKAVHREINKAFWDRGAHKEALSVTQLQKLRTGTREFIESVIRPELILDGINVICFTMNYHQVMSSTYVMAYIRDKFPMYRCEFVAGGMSVAVPFVKTIFERIEIGVTCILGEGENKLEAICRGIAALSEGHTDAEMRRALACRGSYFSADFKNLWIRDPADFKTQISDLAAQPLPDYHEYFSSLRSYCQDDAVFHSIRSRTYVQIEGTRGCFANCDFCGLNYLWDGFRKMQPSKVFERFVRMYLEYGIKDIRFVDNVCDSWAEGFADLMLKEKLRFPIFMELRAHHPEYFWTKLALIGVSEIQVGIEAVSPGVLKLIGKGTKVIQNLAAQKYLTELNIKSMSNLIINYPGSTVDDVQETRRILEAIPHWQNFSLTACQLSIGSPQFEKIPVATRSLLRSYQSVRLRKEHSFLGFEFWISPPSDWVKKEVVTAWKKLARWYERYKLKASVFRTSLKVERNPNGNLTILERRGRGLVETTLEREQSLILEVCHAAPRLETLSKLTGLDEAVIAKCIQDLSSKQFVLVVDGYCISLPLRSREELVQNYYRALAEHGESNSVTLTTANQG